MLKVRDQKLPIELGELLRNATLDANEVIDRITKKDGYRFPYGDVKDNHNIEVGKICFALDRPVVSKNTIHNNSIPILQTLNGHKIRETNSLEILYNMTFVGIARDPMNAGDLPKFVKDKKISDNEVLMIDGRVNTEGKVNVKCFCPNKINYGQYLKIWLPEFEIKKFENSDDFEDWIKNNEYYKGQLKKNKNGRLEPFVIPAEEEGLTITSFMRYSLDKPKKNYDLLSSGKKKETSLVETAKYAQLGARGIGFLMLCHLIKIGRIVMEVPDLIELAKDFGMIGEKDKDEEKEKEKDTNINILNKIFCIDDLDETKIMTELFPESKNIDEKKKKKEDGDLIDIIIAAKNSMNMFDALYKNIGILNSKNIIGRAAGTYDGDKTAAKEIEIDLIK